MKKSELLTEQLVICFEDCYKNDLEELITTGSYGSSAVKLLGILRSCDIKYSFKSEGSSFSIEPFTLNAHQYVTLISFMESIGEPIKTLTTDHIIEFIFMALDLSKHITFSDDTKSLSGYKYNENNDIILGVDFFHYCCAVIESKHPEDLPHPEIKKLQDCFNTICEVVANHGNTSINEIKSLFNFIIKHRYF